MDFPNHFLSVFSWHQCRNDGERRDDSPLLSCVLVRDIGKPFPLYIANYGTCSWMKERECSFNIRKLGEDWLERILRFGRKGILFEASLSEWNVVSFLFLFWGNFSRLVCLFFKKNDDFSKFFPGLSLVFLFRCDC